MNDYNCCKMCKCCILPSGDKAVTECVPVPGVQFVQSAELRNLDYKHVHLYACYQIFICFGMRNIISYLALSQFSFITVVNITINFFVIENCYLFLFSKISLVSSTICQLKCLFPYSSAAVRFAVPHPRMADTITQSLNHVTTNFSFVSSAFVTSVVLCWAVSEVQFISKNTCENID